jgi:hypothetical protein
MDSKTNHFDLGVKVRDLVTGLEGIIIARLEHLNGCVHYAVKPKVGKDNKEVEAHYIDSQQLEKVDAGITKKVVQNNTGGSASGAPRL